MDPLRLSAQVGSILLEASGLVDGDLWSGVTSVLIPELDAQVEVTLGMMTNSVYGAVEGRVLEAGGDTGAEDVVVQIQAEVFAGLDANGPSFSKRVVGTAVTDPSGSFRFARVPVGNYEIYAYRQSTWQETSLSGSLSEAGLETPTLVLPGTAGIVEGIVKDGGNHPVEGARVYVGPFETKPQATALSWCRDCQG